MKKVLTVFLLLCAVNVAAQMIALHPPRWVFVSVPSWDVSAAQKGHYKCNDDAANTTITDDSGQANNGTLGGGDNTVDISQDPGKILKSLLMNGSDDYFNLDATWADVSSATSGAILVWIRPTDVTQNDDVIWQFGDTDANEQVRLLQAPTDGKINGHLRIAGTTQWKWESDNAVIANDTWYQVVIRHDGVAMTLYIDGALVPITFSITTDKTKWFADLTGVDNIRFGCRNSTGGGNSLFWGGQFDDIRILNRDLTSDELAQLYNGGDGTEADGGAL